jgi:hypothetical protein
MVFVAVVCFIVKRHRQGLARPVVTAARTGSATLAGKHEDISHLLVVGLGGTEKCRVGFVWVILGKPPPAYIPHRPSREVWQGVIR